MATDTMTSSATPLLDYSSTGRSCGRRLKWLCLLALVLSNLYFAIDKWGGGARLYARMRLYQHRCLCYSQPAARVVFDSDLTRARLLLAQGYDGSPNWHSKSRAFFPEIQNTFDEFDAIGCNLEPGRTSRIAAGWADGASYSSNPPFQFAVFLHERRSPGGNKRLLVMNAQVDQDNQGITLLFPFVIRPAGLLAGPVVVAAPELRTPFPLFVLGPPDGLRLYAGQADSSDRARFTIAYETPGGKGFFEGRLRDDDGVSLRLVDESFQKKWAPLWPKTGQP